MFRIEFFCDDRRLAAALHALVGVSHGAPTVQPVANLASNGKAKLEGDTIQMFSQYIKKNRLAELRAADARVFCKEAGLAEASYNSVLGRAKKAGLIRKTGQGSGTVWKVAT